MASYAELFDQLPIDDIARKLGIDPDQAGQAISAAIPALLGGMKANAADPAGAESLTKALGDHAGQTLNSIDDIDVNDGQKIVRNVFGEQQDAVVNQLGGLGGLGGGLFSKLLPMLAPLILSWLGGRIFGGGRQQQRAPQPQAQDDGGGLFGGIMDKILGRDDEPEYQAPRQVPAPRQDTGGVDIGGILNDMLGGGRSTPAPAPSGRSSSGGSIPGGLGVDDLLGGLLGGRLGGGRR